MYHWTTEAAAESIKSNGFVLNHAGVVGGAEFGAAIYLAPNRDDAEVWEADMRYYGAADVLLEVAFSGRLFDIDCPEFSEMLFAWAERHGLMANGQPTEAGRAELIENGERNHSYHPANPWMVRMLQEAGYDGLLCVNEGSRRQAVVWNVNSLTVQG